MTALVAHPNNPLQLMSCSFDGTLRIWAVDDGMLIRTIDLSMSSHVTNSVTYKIRGMKGIY